MWRNTAKRLFQTSARIHGIGAAVNEKAADKLVKFDPSVFGNGNDGISSHTVSSPDNRISITVFGGRLSYNVTFNGREIIAQSEIGLKVKPEINTGVDVFLGSPKFEYVNESYPYMGAKSIATDEHVNYKFPVRHKETGLEYTLEVRLWNDGFGFRMIFPENCRMLVKGETTNFKVPIDSICRYQLDPVKLQGKTLEQQTRYLPEKTNMAYQVSIELPERRGYMLLTEANLQNFPGAALQSLGRGLFGINFWNSGDFYVKGCVTPWRLAIITEDLNSMVNSTIVSNAAEPMPDLYKDADWILPGKAVWSYFVNKPISRKYDTILQFNAYAHDLGCGYNVIDSGWRNWGLTESGAFRKVGKIVKDAEPRGVGIWVWKSVTMGPYFPLYRKWFFKKCEKKGVKGVKLDHIESESQFMSRLYRNFAKEAAEHKLMVIYHNPQKPTGLSRTYPNLLSMEAVKGMQNKCDPDDNAILPFTRFVTGGADYTPLCFSIPERRYTASIAHMLANTIINSSPLLTISEHPLNIREQPFAKMLRELPAVWDETVALPQSTLGEAAVFVRRSGEIWYVAAQNSEKGERKLSVSLDFLPNSRVYSLELYQDVLDSQLEVKSGLYNASSKDLLSITMRSGGGFVGVFKEI